MKAMNVKKFHGLKDNGYHSQYMFNTFHMNNDGGDFSEVAQYSGTAKTDWSWSPLFFDMDHDGLCYFLTIRRSPCQEICC